MAISDFDKKKQIDVSSVTGTPSISKAVPLFIVDGDDSTTGTGDIVLDWTNISSKSDIGVYDENDNLVDYCFEKFDTTNSKAVIWTYDTWNRDGTTQLQIAYGGGTSDQSVSLSTVFDKESNLVAGYLFNESSGSLLDVTSNNKDGTVKLFDGDEQEASGQVGYAYDFDGGNDYVDLPTTYGVFDGSSDMTILFSFNPESGYTNKYLWSMDGEGEMHARWNESGNQYLKYQSYAGGSEDNIITSSLAFGSWHRCAFTYDTSATEKEVLVDASSEGTQSAGINSKSNENNFAARNSNAPYAGKIDDVRIYSDLKSSDFITADYDSVKSTPDFFSQQAGETFATVGTGIPVSTSASSLSGVPTTSTTAGSSLVNISSSTLNGLRRVLAGSSLVGVNSSSLTGYFPSVEHATGNVVAVNSSSINGIGTRIVIGSGSLASATTSSISGIGTIGNINVSGDLVSATSSTLQGTATLGITSSGVLVDLTTGAIVGTVGTGIRMAEYDKLYASLATLIDDKEKNDISILKDSRRLATIL